MAEIMETNMPHIMFLKQFPKSRRHIIRLNQIADYIDADITQVFFVVSAAACGFLPVVLLPPTTAPLKKESEDKSVGWTYFWPCPS